MKNHYCQIKLSENSPTITLVYLPNLNLYVITDAKGFGQHWIRVSYCQKVYDTKLLLGIDADDYMTSIARHFAEPIIKYKLSTIQDPLIMVKEIVLTLSISLRDKDPKHIKMICEEFAKYFQEKHE
ncbi:hypothetical protein DERF_003186 [Dermatophagoides farinae]|uniref:Uncharacterized protein n=1 Tax=Dermatophagoides farinae TaxID=6954 RepID=A0A922IDS2_DERFA|nr:hypothetical protein HUG17_5192 [Dermatophagoides farinae]KAH9529295.1 hypothetical protein DERF_003186 [Dermatophagoides farinae]